MAMLMLPPLLLLLLLVMTPLLLLLPMLLLLPALLLLLLLAATVVVLHSAVADVPAAAVVVANVAVATAVIRLQESSLCHLELLCRAALIWVHSSFLHDFDRLIDCSQSLNCAFPSGVIWKAARAATTMLANSS